jgi:release factor glutamine methyltransferase
MARALTWKDELNVAVRLLTEAGVGDARREARLLLADALDTHPAGLIAREDDMADSRTQVRWAELLARRAGGEPISRIRGWKEFYGRRFVVTRDVLDPRPETEHVVEAVLEHLPRGGRMLDLGTGSGCILVSVLAERPDALGVGLDASADALAIARSNASAHQVDTRAEWMEGDFGAMDMLVAFDVVASNPPYIPTADIQHLAAEVREHDPLVALEGGADGLEAYRRLVPEAKRVLKRGGWLVLEVGAGQAEAVRALLAGEGFVDLVARRDLAGIERVVEGLKP